MAIDLKLIKQLREETQASVADVKKALDEAGGDLKKAKEVLQKKGFEAASKKADRTTEQGVIEAYVHGGGKIGVLVELLCETDFVAKTDEFKQLGHEIAMQVAAMNPKDTEELLKQEYIRDSSKTIEDLRKGAIAKLGENITLKRFERFAIGEKESLK
jgi:elongation factor Ts